MIILSTGKFHQTKIIMFLVRAVQLYNTVKSKGSIMHAIFPSVLGAAQDREKLLKYHDITWLNRPHDEMQKAVNGKKYKLFQTKTELI